MNDQIRRFGIFVAVGLAAAAYVGWAYALWSLGRDPVGLAKLLWESGVSSCETTGFLASAVIKVGLGLIVFTYASFVIFGIALAMGFAWASGLALTYAVSDMKEGLFFILLSALVRSVSSVLHRHVVQPVARLGWSCTKELALLVWPALPDLFGGGDVDTDKEPEIPGRFPSEAPRVSDLKSHTPMTEDGGQPKSRPSPDVHTKDSDSTGKQLDDGGVRAGPLVGKASRVVGESSDSSTAAGESSGSSAATRTPTKFQLPRHSYQRFSRSVEPLGEGSPRTWVRQRWLSKAPGSNIIVDRVEVVQGTDSPSNLRLH